MAALDVHDRGEGTPVVLLHGLTATHRYVVMGSKDLERWDALADGLERGGVDGFVAAYGPITGPWAETTERVIRQRLGLHEHPEAVAQALRQVPRSRPFDSLDE